ncbi:BlaI/MecI/CopY family transcriptional regulator [Candidatus Latescibacterota bacterium]
MTTRQLTNAELVLIEQLWKLGEACPEDVQNSLLDAGKDVTGGTVRKMLLILVKKGHAVRKKVGRKYIYQAAKKQETTRKALLKDLINRAFDGSPSLMVASLIEDRSVSMDDFEEIKRMIEDYNKEETE